METLIYAMIIALSTTFTSGLDSDNKSRETKKEAILKSHRFDTPKDKDKDSDGGGGFGGGGATGSW